MLIALDIGNTNITVGAFNNDDLVASWRLSTDPHCQMDEYALQIKMLLPMKGVSVESIREAAICSVVPPLTTVFEEVCQLLFGVVPLVVGIGTKTGVDIMYDNPKDVGSDRVVDAAATYHLYGGPAVIVDFGTATVFDAISGSGGYLGGAISPGLQVGISIPF